MFRVQSLGIFEAKNLSKLRHWWVRIKRHNLFICVKFLKILDSFWYWLKYKPSQQPRKKQQEKYRETPEHVSHIELGNGTRHNEANGDRSVHNLLQHQGQRDAPLRRRVAQQLQKVSARLVHHRPNPPHRQERAGPLLRRPDHPLQDPVQLSRAARRQPRSKSSQTQRSPEATKGRGGAPPSFWGAGGGN